MMLDKKLAKLLSEFCLDLAKAWAIGTFITPVLSKEPVGLSTLSFGVMSVILMIGFSRVFLEMYDRKF